MACTNYGPSSSTQAAQIRSSEAFSTLRSDLQLFVERWAEGKRTMTELISTEAEMTRDHITTDGGLTRRRIDDIGTIIESDSVQRKKQEVERNLGDEHKRILSTLWFPEMNERENSIQEASPDTVDWIFEDRMFRGLKFHYKDWLQSEKGGPFWICGKPGSGKSTLVKSIVRNRQATTHLEMWRAPIRIYKFYFYEMGTNSLQKQLRGCLSTLLYQILADINIWERLVQAQPELGTKRSGHDWSLEELGNTLHGCLEIDGSASCVFIDGLDEIQSHERSAIVKLVISLNSHPNVKVCVSSRPEPLFQRTLESYPTLQVQDFTYHSILLYAERALEEYRISLDINKDVYKKLVDEIIQKSDGVFLWVVLAVTSLARGIDNGDTLDTMLQRTNELSPGIYELYKQMWKRNNEDLQLYRQEAAEIFWFHLVSLERHGTWDLSRTVFLTYMLGTHRILRDEIQHFISVHGKFTIDDETRISRAYLTWLSARSAGLLEVQYGIFERPIGDKPFEWKIQFIHRSVREFLQNTIDGQKVLSYDQRSLAEKWLTLVQAIIATSHILINGFSGFEIIQNEPAFVAGILSIALKLSKEAQWGLVDLGDGKLERRPSIHAENRVMFLQTAALSGATTFFLEDPLELYKNLNFQEALGIAKACIKGLTDELGIGEFECVCSPRSITTVLYEFGFTKPDFVELNAELWKRQLSIFNWLLKTGCTFDDSVIPELRYRAYPSSFAIQEVHSGTRLTVRATFYKACFYGIRHAVVNKEIAHIVLDCLRIFDKHRKGAPAKIYFRYNCLYNVYFWLDAAWFSYIFEWLETGKSLDSLPISHGGDDRGSAYIEIYQFSNKKMGRCHPNRGIKTCLEKVKSLESTLELLLRHAYNFEKEMGIESIINDIFEDEDGGLYHSPHVIGKIDA